MHTNALIFGYGSLLQPKSLRATAPSARNIRAVYIKGFRREFTLWDPVGWSETNLDLAGMPFCAVNIRPVDNSSCLVNGIVFEVSELDFPALLKREEGYELIETEIYDPTTHKPAGTCKVFSAAQPTGEYDFGSAAQRRYLDVCLEGAERHGEDFLREFILTTFIGNKNLEQIPRLELESTALKRNRV